MHEILTLQLGQRANYLATHFWNTQESYHTFPPAPTSPVDHDVHFRSGIGVDGSETYLPRTVIYDLKGGFGSLRRVNELYEMEGGGGGGAGGEGVWSHPSTLITLPPIAPSQYHTSLLNASSPPAPLTPSTVRYWSDFTHTYFHPRSIVQLNDYTLNSTLMPFEKYESGDELFESLDKEHDLLDRDLRLWAEECDQMQGVQVFAGADDAWGGFAARYVERIRDEYGKIGVWVFGLDGGTQGGPRSKILSQTLNTARSLHDLSLHASIYTPLTLPTHLPSSVTLDRTSPWHTSALLSAALETITLPSRMRPSSHNQRRTLNDLEAALNVNGNQTIARLKGSVLFESEEGKKEEKGTRGRGKSDERMPQFQGGKANVLWKEDDDSPADATPSDLDIDFFPSLPQNFGYSKRKSSKTPHLFGQVSSYRGTLCGTRVDENKDNEEEIGYTRKRRRIAGLPLLETYRTPLPYPLLPTFPPIFSSPSSPLSSVSIKTSLATSTQTAVYIKELSTLVMQSKGYAGEEREALGNGLAERAEGFLEGGWEGRGESSGSDD